MPAIRGSWLSTRVMIYARRFPRQGVASSRTVIDRHRDARISRPPDLPTPSGTQTPRLLRQERQRRRIERDAILAAGVLDRDLLLPHVPADALRVAREGIAPPAGPCVDVAEHVTAMQHERALRGQLLRGRRARIQDV